MKEITNPGKKGYKKKANHDQIHKKPTAAGRERNPPAWHNWRVCPYASEVVKSAALAREEPAAAGKNEKVSS